MKILVLDLSSFEELIMSMPVFDSLKKNFYESEINLVTFEENIPIIKEQKSIDNIFGITLEERENNFKYFFKVLKILRKKYDIIIDLTSDKKSGLFSLLSFGVKYKIRKDKNKILNFRATYLVPEEERYCDEVEKKLRFLEPLEKIKNSKIIYEKEIKLDILSEEKKKIKSQFIKEGMDISLPVFACLGNSFEMEKVVKKLLEKNINIVLAYTEKNEKEIKNFAEKINNKKIYLFKINKLRDYVGFFANCDFIFGEECEERYIAQGVGVPTFIVFNNSKKWIANYGTKFQGILNSKITEDYQGITENKKFEEINCENIYSNIEKMLKENKIILDWRK